MVAGMTQYAVSIGRTYAAVWFCESPWVGAWFALVTAFYPRAAVSGLAGLLMARLWGRLLGIAPAGDAHWVNGLLCGLFIGAFHTLDVALVGLVALSAFLVTLLTPWLAALLWRAGKLPVLSLPFALVIVLLLLALGPAGLGAEPLPYLGIDTSDIFDRVPKRLENFFTAVGWLLLVPYPLTGALIFAGVLFASRYLALLAAAGYMAGELMLAALGHGSSANTAFNFMLASVAVGGLFSIPGRASFVMAMAAGALAACLGLALAPVLSAFQLPALTLPFVCAVYLCLGGLATRVDARAPYLTLDQPAAPEAAYERRRLAQARGAAAHSVPLLAPFYGEWTVSQGFNGEHTHKAPWQHALDFQITEEGRDHRGHRGDGASCADYFCFGAPLIAPVAGRVTQLQNELPDQPPGNVDVVNNWGNYLMIRTVTGAHVLLAHLKQGSVTVKAGEWVAAGQPVAACGSSGRSPVPHLHMQVQADGVLGSATIPFHLTHIIERTNTEGKEFRLCATPDKGVGVTAAPADEQLASAVRIPLGGTATYQMTSSRILESGQHQLTTQLTLLGQHRLTTQTGASAACEETACVMGFYDRDGAPSRALDMWLLALGLTPLSPSADRWRDRPALRLLPLSAPRRLLAALLRPLGGGCDSSYRRYWDEDTHCWIQEGVHRFALLPGVAWSATTRAWAAPASGVMRVRLEILGEYWELVRQSPHGGHA